MITAVVTGKDDPQEKQIDEALCWMQVALFSVDAIKVMGESALSDEKTQAQLFIGSGTDGSTVVFRHRMLAASGRFL